MDTNALLTIAVDLLANMNERLERVEQLLLAQAGDAAPPNQPQLENRQPEPPPYPNQAARVAAHFHARIRNQHQ